MRMYDAMVSSHSLSNVRTSIADAKSLLIFQSIASETVESEGVLKKTNLTRKQYHSRLSAIVEEGLAMRKNRKYSLTSLGKIVYRLTNNNPDSIITGG
jgi:predicted transcriptional regulator